MRSGEKTYHQLQLATIPIPASLRNRNTMNIGMVMYLTVYTLQANIVLLY